MVTEYFGGGTLDYHLRDRKYRFKEHEAKFIIACLLQGLEFVHNNGVLHRDIRPQNLVIDKETGYVRLTGFEFARIYTELNAADSSGTPGYIAPEVLFRQNYSFTSDFFGVGAIIYEMLLG